jgi:hypothetical protein
MTSPNEAMAPALPPAATLIPMRRVDLLFAAGITYPSTYDQWRWLYRQRKQRGLDRAFVPLGRRVLVDVEAFRRAVREPENQSDQSPRG